MSLTGTDTNPIRAKVLIVDDRPENIFAMPKILESLDVEHPRRIANSDEIAGVFGHDHRPKRLAVGSNSVLSNLEPSLFVQTEQHFIAVSSLISARVRGQHCTNPAILPIDRQRGADGNLPLPR